MDIHKVIEASDFGVSVHDEPGKREVTGIGELDLTALEPLKAAFDVDRDVTITLDFGAVTFMDSSVLGVVLRGVRGRPQVAMVASNQVRRLLELSSTDDLFLLS